MIRKEIRVIFDGEVVVSPHFSGIGRYTLELLRAIDRQVNNDGSTSFSLLINHRQISRAREFKFRNIKLMKSPFSMKMANILKRLGMQLPLDIFFGRGIYVFPNFTSWPLLFSKNVTFIYDITYEKYPEFVERRNQIFLSNQVEKSSKRADMVATISKSSKNDISNLYELDKQIVKIFYPGVQNSIFFRRTLSEIEYIKNKYHIKGDYILFVGNIEPRKNIKSLLLAYEQLPEDVQKQNSLLIVGAKGWNDKEILSIIKRLQSNNKSILFPCQWVVDDDLPAIYSGAKMLVYPSLYEGFGIPPIEAMACGIPVISANNSSLPEAVGNAALLINAQSVDEISSAITRLLSDNRLRQRLIDMGYTQVEQFSWDETAKKFLESIRRLGLGKM